jgi:methylphosphotriester-DNA--protein-cysteine methyltransferase
MISHIKIGNDDSERSRAIKKLIHDGAISFAGNRQLKIYGTLRCSSGRRMKTTNRVFFKSIAEAKHAGYRPCGHCMKKEYEKWKTAK